nr:MAG TPA: hypothetical protein [Caudoviricetes sp.]
MVNPPPPFHNNKKGGTQRKAGAGRGRTQQGRHNGVRG